MLRVRLTGARRVKSLENMREVFVRDTLAPIPDCENSLVLITPQRQRNFILRLSMLQGVVEQIDQTCWINLPSIGIISTSSGMETLIIRCGARLAM